MRNLLVKDGIGQEMTGQFFLHFWLPRKSQGSFTWRKSATWDRQLYFPSEGRHAVDFFARKIWRLRQSSNPQSWVPEASMPTTRPPKPLQNVKETSLFSRRIKCGSQKFQKPVTLHLRDNRVVVAPYGTYITYTEMCTWNFEVTASFSWINHNDGK
jgi:hypothetical protein